MSEPIPEGDVAALRQGLALFKARRYADVEVFCHHALLEHPQSVDLWNLRGVNARTAKRYTDAIASFRQGLTIAPQNAAIWSNLGNALKDIKQCESAVVCHRRAIALDGGKVTTLHNLGIALTAAGRDSEAIAAYDGALEIDPQAAGVRWDRALSRLRMGDCIGGWADYESRIVSGRLPQRELPGLRWSGERFEGKRLLIVSEQGLGDTIWVSRCFKRVKELGGELVIECRPEVAQLIASMGVADDIVPKRDPLPDADFHILQCSLPGLLGDFPSSPYLAAPREHAARIAPLLSGSEGKLRVGIIWGGSPTYEGRNDRDAPLRLFLQWFAHPHVQLYSLQKGPQASDLKSLPAGAPIIDLAPHTADMFETAAAVAQLDLVLMTDTAVAHLAGALGAPVWVLLSRVPYWLWQHERSDSPWYPSMRLFRQRAWGDWHGAFDQAAAALLEMRPPTR